MKKIALAFINVHDKTGVLELAAFLAKKGVEIVGTTPTCKLLEKNGIHTMDVSALTGMSDVSDDKLQALHPAIFSGIMAGRKEQAQLDQLKKIGGRQIDLIIINPLPMDVNAPEAAEGAEPLPDPFSMMDVGGMALLRASVKNYQDVSALVSPEQYHEFMDEFAKHDGTLTPEYKRKLTLAVLELTAGYDIMMYKHLFHQAHRDRFLPDTLFLTYKKAMELRYGENPHQKACFYKEPNLYGVSLADATVLKGGPLNYNQAFDLNLALEIVMEFDKTAVTVIRHGMPLGVALDKDMCKAYIRARDVEGASAIGAVVAFNGQVEKRTAKELTNTYIEAVIAPKYTDGALEQLKSAKKGQNLRVLQVTGKKWTKQAGTLNTRSMLGGVLVQENNDLLLPEGAHMKVMSKRKLTRKQLADLILAWKVAKHSNSNAVILAKDLQTIGTGAGQNNRLEALKMAFDKAGENAVGCVMAFDTTIPFRNIIDEAAKYGITAIIQPGGAMRDDEVTLACDEHNVALAVTGMRHFKH